MPRSRVEKRPQALWDLAEIAVYLAEEGGNDELGFRFLDAAEASFDELAAMPEMGAARQYNDPAIADLRMWRVAAAAIVLAAAATLPQLLDSEPPPRPARRFTIKSPYGGNFRADNTSSLALSPDGMMLVSQGFSGAEDTLYVRALAEAASHPLLNASSSQPFFSPDGKWLGFVSTLGLFKINLGGGAPIKIATFPTARA